MQFAYTILYVPDVAATVAFYEAAFGLTPRFIHESGAYAEMETGGTKLAFAAESMWEENGVHTLSNRPGGLPAGFEIAFGTDDVQAAVDKAVAAGATLLAPAKTKPWGQVVAYVADLNNVLVELCTLMPG